ncbi:MAG: hypothetical protein MJ246_02270 [Clostridia bacterium]|nr:hypothetical protein [Clostridia bacterium]
MKSKGNVKKEKTNSYDAEKVLNTLKEKIEKIDSSKEGFDENEIIDVLVLIDKEIEKSTKRMQGNLNAEDAKKESDSYMKFANLNRELLEKTAKMFPFESFFYSDDKSKEKVLSDFFRTVNEKVHFFDLDIDENRGMKDAKEALEEKNNKISDSLIEVLEEKLKVNFSDHQKSLLKNDFKDVAEKVTCDFDEILEECDKIKTVSNIKLISRPSYKNFISKKELKKLDSSDKLSTLRLNFLPYISSSDEEKKDLVSESISSQLKGIKDLLDVRKEDYYKRIKFLFLLIALSLVVTTAAPTAGALGIITIGSAAAFMQTKIIMTDNRIQKINRELDLIEKGESKIVLQTIERVNETAREILDDPKYKEIVEKYVKKKKKDKEKEKELKEKIEKEMRDAINITLDQMNDNSKERVIAKVGEKYSQVVNEINKTNSNLLKDNDRALEISNAIDNIVDIELGDDKEEEISFNVQLEV